MGMRDSWQSHTWAPFCGISCTRASSRSYKRLKPRSSAVTRIYQEKIPTLHALMTSRKISGIEIEPNGPGRLEKPFVIEAEYDENAPKSLIPENMVPKQAVRRKMSEPDIEAGCTEYFKAMVTLENIGCRSKPVTFYISSKISKTILNIQADYVASSTEHGSSVYPVGFKRQTLAEKAAQDEAERIADMKRKEEVAKYTQTKKQEHAAYEAAKQNPQNDKNRKE